MRRRRPSPPCKKRWPSRKPTRPQPNRNCRLESRRFTAKRKRLWTGRRSAPSPNHRRASNRRSLLPPQASLPKPPALEPVLGAYRAYVLREVEGGRAIVEGAHGLEEVVPGDILPGGARVEKIERHGATMAGSDRSRRHCPRRPLGRLSRFSARFPTSVSQKDFGVQSGGKEEGAIRNLTGHEARRDHDRLFRSPPRAAQRNARRLVRCLRQPGHLASEAARNEIRGRRSSLRNRAEIEPLISSAP